MIIFDLAQKYGRYSHYPIRAGPDVFIGIIYNLFLALGQISNCRFLKACQFFLILYNSIPQFPIIILHNFADSICRLKFEFSHILCLFSI